MQPTCFCTEANAEAKHLFRATDENRRASLSTFDYYRCGSCGLTFLGEVPSDLSKYYQDEYYEIPALARIAKIAKKQRFRIDVILQHIQGKYLLEIGPAFGVLAWQAKQAGLNVTTIEMDEKCCEFLRETVGVTAIQSESPEKVLPTLGLQDAIVLWHVIEHLVRPVSLLPHLASRLNPDGILVISTPNPQAWQFSVMGRHWPHLDAPRHTALIPSDVLEQHCKKLGLELIYLNSNNADSQSWDRFGWQRLLMNRMPSGQMQKFGFVLGTALSCFFAPWDRRRGSAYTAIFQKRASR